jgi:hypothetical protein
MNRKIYVTASDMLALREQGLSNHDIAKSLDVSIQTVRRYIGKQGGHMESLEAFRDTPPKKKAKTESVTPIYEPKPVLERYVVGDYVVEMDSVDRTMLISGESGDTVLEYKDVPDLVCFLAWAMRARMEVTEDADKLEAEGRTI